QRRRHPDARAGTADRAAGRARGDVGHLWPAGAWGIRAASRFQKGQPAPQRCRPAHAGMKRAIAVSLLIGGWVGQSVAVAQGDGAARPSLHPTRDVEIVYQTPSADTQHGGRPLEQRMRWLLAGQVMRIDPPTPGMHVIIDYLARQMSVVRDGDRS